MLPDYLNHRLFVMKESDYNENNVNDALYYQNIPDNILFKYSNVIDWRLLSKYQKLSENTIDMFANYLHWPFISQYQNFKQSPADKYMYTLSWSNVSSNLLLSEEFFYKKL